MMHFYIIYFEIVKSNIGTNEIYINVVNILSFRVRILRWKMKKSYESTACDYKVIGFKLLHHKLQWSKLRKFQDL